MLSDSLSEQDWAHIGRKLLRADQVMQWWIGDWAAFGSGDERQVGWRKRGALKEFCSANGFDYGNVSNKCWVSKSVHLSLRRESLPWSYYQEVAPLKPKDQIKWINLAQSEDLSVSDLRCGIRRGGASIKGFESDGPTIKYAVNYPGEYVSDLLTWLKERPDGFWTPEMKERWRSTLDPIVEIYHALA
jgi:hypothetical protein